MPFPLLVVGVAVVVSLVRGGRFGRIPDADLRGAGLLFGGLALQVFVDAAAARGWVTGSAGYALLLISQGLVVGWAWINRFRPGLPLVGLGLLLNAIVIGANGAMPVGAEAIERLGLAGAEVPPGKHELLTDATVLPWLADIFPLPPIRTIISIGDMVLAAGLIPLVHHLMSFRTPAERRGGRRSPDDPAASADTA